MSSSPAFQTYVNDFLGSAKVRLMTTTEFGAYWFLLFLDWQEGGFVYNEDDLAMSCKLRPAQFKRAWDRILHRCFHERDGRFWNPRLERERVKQAEWRERSSRGGRASAQVQLKCTSSAVEVHLKGGSSAVEGCFKRGRLNTPLPLPLPLPSLKPSTTARVRERLSEDDRPAFDSLFSRVPDPDTWAAECDAMLEGMAGHHRATPAQLARAIVDYTANGKAGAPNIRQFRRYVEGAINDKPTSSVGADTLKLWHLMKTYGFANSTQYTIDAELERALGDSQITDAEAFKQTLRKLDRAALRDVRTDADALRIIARSLGADPIQGMA